MNDELLNDQNDEVAENDEMNEGQVIDLDALMDILGIRREKKDYGPAPDVIPVYGRSDGDKMEIKEHNGVVQIVVTQSDGTVQVDPAGAIERPLDELYQEFRKMCDRYDFHELAADGYFVDSETVCPGCPSENECKVKRPQ